MIKLKEGQKLISEAGDIYETEAEDVLVEAKIEENDIEWMKMAKKIGEEIGKDTIQQLENECRKWLGREYEDSVRDLATDAMLYLYGTLVKNYNIIYERKDVYNAGYKGF